MNYKSCNKSKRHKKSKGNWRLNRYFGLIEYLNKELRAIKALDLLSSKDHGSNP